MQQNIGLLSLYLQEMGIQIAMMTLVLATFTYNLRFPLHTLKVDREFVNEVTTDPKRRSNHRVGSSARTWAG